MKLTLTVGVYFTVPVDLKLNNSHLFKLALNKLKISFELYLYFPGQGWAGWRKNILNNGLIWNFERVRLVLTLLEAAMENGIVSGVNIVVLGL